MSTQKILTRSDGAAKRVKNNADAPTVTFTETSADIDKAQARAKGGSEEGKNTASADKSNTSDNSESNAITSGSANNDVDAAALKTTARSEGALVEVKKTYTVVKSDRGDNESKSAENPSILGCVNNTVTPTSTMSIDASITAKIENEVSSKINTQKYGANQEPKTPKSSQNHGDTLVEIPTSDPGRIYSSLAADSRKIDSSQKPKSASDEQSHHSNPPKPNGDNDALGTDPLRSALEAGAPTFSETDRGRSCKASERKRVNLEPGCGNGSVENGLNGKVTEKPPEAHTMEVTDKASSEVNSQKIDSANKILTRRRTRSLSRELAAAGVAKKASGVGSQKIESPDRLSTRSRTRSLPRELTAAGSNEKAGEVDSQINESPDRAPISSRRRSLSSALSSLSGGESHADSGVAGIDLIFDNDGKTPLRTNGRMSTTSQGPVRKRHKNKGRTLFRKNSETAESITSQGGVIGNAAIPNEDTLPPLGDDEGAMLPPGVTFAGAKRPRSDTIDSFRAAMDSQHNDLPTESIVLPEMKDPEIREDGGDGINDSSNAKKVEDMIGLSNNDSDNNPPMLLPSPGGMISDSILGSLRGRGRSDTIDFLASAVEFQVGGDGSVVENVEDIHPTPVYVMSDATTSNSDKGKSADATKKAGIALQSQEISSLKSDGSKSRSQRCNLEPRSLGNDMNKGVAFGKTPKKTNLSRTKSQSSSELSSLQGPLRKRYRTRSLSFALSGQDAASKPLAQPIEKMKPVEPKMKCAAIKKGGVKRDEIFAGGRSPRTRSLSCALSDQENSSHRALSHPNEQAGPPKGGSTNIGNDETDTNSTGRDRSNTLDSFHSTIFGNRSRSDTLDKCFGVQEEEEEEEEGGGRRRPRSDTLDFLTAAVAGDMGHDLDAAMAAAGDDEASFAVHTVSAPSGASARYSSAHRSCAPPPPGQKQRPRSDTLDSTASSINSARLDFLVSVASEQGMLTSPVPRREELPSAVGNENCENSSDSAPQHQRRPRSNTLEIYSNMNSASRTRSDTVDFLTGANDSSDSAVVGRRRSDTVDFLCGANVDDEVANFDEVVNLTEESGDGNTEHNSNVMDHLKALCDEPKISGSKTARILKRKRLSSTDLSKGLASPRARTAEDGSDSAATAAHKKARKNSESTGSGMPRNRLESWGGMSDLSVGVGAMHSVLKDTGILDDVLAAAAELGDGDGLSSEASIQKSRAAVSGGGSRSSSGDPVAPAAAAATTREPTRPRLESAASMSLGELSDSTPVSIAKAVPAKTAPAKAVPAKKVVSKETTESVSTPSITVDYDAIAAAVNAATAATDGLDLSAILGTPTSKDAKRNQKGGNAKQSQNKNLKLAAPLPKKYAPPSAATMKCLMAQSQKKAPLKLPMVTSTPAIKGGPQVKVPQTTTSGPSKITPKGKPFPVAAINIPFVPIPKCTKTKEELEAIQARARAAAGYVPPPKTRKTPLPPRKAAQFNPNLNPLYRPGMPSHIPIKKRGVPHLQRPPGTPMMPESIHSNNPHQTPPSYNKPGAKMPLSYIKPPHSTTPSSSRRPPSATLQSQQKWDDTFDCLVRFIEETREKCTKQMSEEEKAKWVWDGNVPTSYKSPCGKALGRWINNQRSAKAKGTLKDDREVRLVSTGLKWSVLTTNSWRLMVRELEIYVNEQTKNGQIWDGNVPTNYKIKSHFPPMPGAEDADDEKNLGRWVNRQRSLYQAGKLKKDRQQDLERIGLKWSVLLTTSWSSMFESLKAYVEEKRKASPDNTWDGNVPANFKTRTNPPLSLGRWVNRQRSAHAKGQLKEDHVKKLEEVGLKWVMHMRHVRTTTDSNREDGAKNIKELEGGESVPQNVKSCGSANLAQQKSDVAPPPAPASNGVVTLSTGNSSAQQQKIVAHSSSSSTPSASPKCNIQQ